MSPFCFLTDTMNLFGIIFEKFGNSCHDSFETTVDADKFRAKIARTKVFVLGANLNATVLTLHAVCVKVIALKRFANSFSL